MKNYRETSAGFSVSEITPVTIGNTITETTIFSQNIIGGKMGINKMLKYQILCTVTTPAVSIPTLQVKMKLGATTLNIITATSLAANITTKPFIIEGMIANTGVANSQIAYGKVIQNGLSIPIVTSSASIMEAADWTVDTTQDQLFSVTIQFGGLSLTTSITFKYATLDLS